jgi:hypothetical protein
MNNKLLLAKDLHKPIRVHFEGRYSIYILTKGVHDLWEEDLLELKKYSKENKEYVYLLNVIDTFSKFVWAIPIKNKDGVRVSKDFEKKII